MDATLDALIARLTTTAGRALEAAFARAGDQGNPTVEAEHILLELIGHCSPVIFPVLDAAGIERDRLRRELERAVRGAPRGRARQPTLARNIGPWFRAGWLLASLSGQRTSLDAAALLLAALEGPAARERLMDAAPCLRRVDVEALRPALPRLLERPREGRPVGLRPGAEPAAAPDSGPLATYTVDLTALARSGEIDPIIGREREIRQVVDILARRRQNNPILVGEPGVGKTAIVEGLARRIAAGEVPPGMEGVELRTLDLTLLQAGASLQGEFEARLDACVRAVQASPTPIILFIDEAHALIGAGGNEGRGDAANLLKPALARGTLRTVAATTWAEYKQYFEADAALARRFQVVRVDEPEPDAAIAMMRAMAPVFEAHHGVTVLDEAVEAAVRLSTRYLAGRRLPDKAVAVLDTACARVAMGQKARPARIEGLAAHVARLETEIERLELEAAAFADHRARLAELMSTLEDERTALAEATDRWTAERALVERIIAQARALAAGAPSGGADAARLALGRDREHLALVQGDEPMVPLEVDRGVVASIIADWTGVPAGELHADAAAALLGLPTRLRARVIGQDAAIETLCRRLRIAGAGLEDPTRPLGVFLLAGPSGVGKTETAHALTEALFGGSASLVVINLSEYQEAHTVSGLRGAPPGYVGYGRGGVLTEAVRRRPYAVVLLDEIEKAHADVLELFYQVFDKGRLEDGQGVPVDFRNTLILATSNVADEAIAERVERARSRAHIDVDALIDGIRPTLLDAFPAALLGRMTVVPYLPLGIDELRRIARLKLGAVAERFAARYAAEVDWGDEVVERLIDARGAVHAGARAIEQRLNGRLMPALSTAILERLTRGDDVGAVRVRGAPSGGFVIVEPGGQADRAPERTATTADAAALDAVEPPRDTVAVEAVAILDARPLSAAPAPVDERPSALAPSALAPSALAPSALAPSALAPSALARSARPEIADEQPEPRPPRGWWRRLWSLGD